MRFPRFLAYLTAMFLLLFGAGSAALADPGDPTVAEPATTETTSEAEPTTETTSADPDPTTETTSEPDPTTETTTEPDPTTETTSEPDPTTETTTEPEPTTETTSVSSTPTETTTEPTSGAAPTASIGEITRDGCLVSIPVTTTGAATFVLQVWDDGEVIDAYVWTTTDDGTETVMWTITMPAGADVTGVGFWVSEVGGTEDLDGVDPWEYPDDVADSCSAAVPVTVEVSGYSGDSVEPGATVTVAGQGFLPGEDVVVTFESTPVEVGTFVVDADGSFTGEMTVPADATDGEHHVVGSGQTSLRVGSDELAVLAATDPTTDPGETSASAGAGGLPDTGVDESSAPLAITAVGLLTAGAAILLIRRRTLAMR